MDPTEQLEQIHRLAKQQVAARLRELLGIAEQKAIDSVPKFDIHLPPVFAALAHLRDPDCTSRYCVAWGGRGSGKSWSVARYLLQQGTKEKIRILCAREFQRSIADSVHLLLSDQIKELGLDNFYKVFDTYIEGANGTMFLFAGLWANTRGIKSMEGIDILWVEEAEKVSESSWKLVLPTIRKKGSKIIITFNPALETDPTYLRFVVAPPPGSMLIPCSWRDNPHLTEELRFEMEHDRERDHDAYMHVWEGQCVTKSDAQILNGKWEVQNFEDHDGINPLYGLDFGFSTDPNAGNRMYIKDECLYITHEHHRHREEIDHTAEGVIGSLPGVEERPIRCDCARPESISYLTRHGLPKAIPGDKWPDSVEDGIKILRAFKKIIIHERCKYTIQEARLWSYKIDPHTDDVLAEVKSGNDHHWDAIRYGLSKIIRQSTSKGGMLEFYRRLAAEAAAGKEDDSDPAPAQAKPQETGDYPPNMPPQ